MGTGKPRISTVAAELADRVGRVELAPGRGLAELELGPVAVLELAIAPVQAEPEHDQAVAELELVTAPVVEPELETAPVVELELVISQVEVELELVQVVAELEHVQAEAELELVRAVVPLRTKSVIAPHHPDLVRLLAAEDLPAVGAETTRGPVATEAATAWEVGE